MANHYNISFFMFIRVLGSFLIIGLSATPATKARDLITNVCSKTQNPTLCFQALRADHRATKSDLKGLAFISLDIASNNELPTLKLLNTLAKSTTVPILKSRYGDCKQLYVSSMNALNAARNGLKVGNANIFTSIVSSAKQDIFFCQQEIEQPPKADSSQIRAANERIQGLCNIAQVIGTMLKQ